MCVRLCVCAHKELLTVKELLYSTFSPLSVVSVSIGWGSFFFIIDAVQTCPSHYLVFVVVVSMCFG